MTMPSGLLVGAGRLDRRLDDPIRLLRAYRTDDGLRYLDYRPSTPPDKLVPDDLAVTILINSRATGSAFKSVQDFGHELALGALPDLPLEETSVEDRDAVADVIAHMTAWPGFGASIATKVLHKKRPCLIPILDNQAIFGAYMNPGWPAAPARLDTIKDRARIREGLEWIYADLVRSENETTWTALHDEEPTRAQIQLFDMVWWSYFREVEPVQRSR